MAVERRSALLRDSSALDPARTALHELVEWSYDLLHGDEKTLLQQLAVHRGGASLASLAAVGATRGLNEATVGYLVAALVDKGAATAAILCSPVSVAQTRAAAVAGARMPQKTTFFTPKPRSGMVFRKF